MIGIWGTDVWETYTFETGEGPRDAMLEMAEFDPRDSGPALLSQATGKSPVLLPCSCPYVALLLGAATPWVLVPFLWLVLVWCLCPLFLLLLRCSYLSSPSTRSVLVLLGRCYSLRACLS